MPEPLAQVRRPQIPALTSLRFFAALAIVVLHATNHGLLPAEWAQRVDLSQAVSFFFVLSGFVLGYAYGDRPYSIRRFYRARWARVWPAAALSIVMVPLVLPPGLYLPPPGSSWSPGVVLLLALAGLQSLVPIPVVFFGANAVTWSISTEAVFYVLFPWLQRQVQLRPWRVLLLVLGIGLALAVLAIALRLPGFAADRLQQPVWEGLVYVNPLARLAEFLVGLLAARWYLAGVLQARLQQFAWPQRLWVVTLLELLALAILALAPKLLQNSPWLAALAPPLQLVFLQWVYGLCFASLILVVALQAGLFSRLLTLKAFVSLGEISYGLYLYHQIVMLRLIQVPMLSLAGHLLPRPGFVEVLGLSLLLAGLSWWLVERRCLLWLRPAGAPRE